jgi:cell division protein FtsL
MATLATMLDRFTTPQRRWRGAAARAGQRGPLRGSRVSERRCVSVREAHRQFAGTSRSGSGGAQDLLAADRFSFAFAVVVIALLLPSLNRLMAGYKMEALRQERQRLELDRASLELAETKLLSPARLEELARMQRFVDPAPEAVVYLEGNKSDAILAKK